jgi:signal transduction histidine kinase
MRIRSKLTVLLLGVGTISVLVPTALAYSRSAEALRKGVEEQLMSHRQTKVRHIESYMSDAKRNVQMLAGDPNLADALVEFRQALEDVPSAAVTSDLEEWFYELFGDWDKAVDALPASGKLVRLQQLFGSDNPFPPDRKEMLFDPGDGSRYADVHSRRHGFLRRAKEIFGFSDLLILDARSGVSVYSVKKRPDFATDLLRGPFRNMNGARAVQGALSGTTRFADFENYEANKGLPTAFVASPIVINGAVEGAVLVLIPIDEITKVMTGDQQWATEGLGATGETFLVGADMMMRSDSRFLTEDLDGLLSDIRKMGASKAEADFITRKGTTVLAFPVKSRAAERSLKGEEGVEEVMGYRGRKVIAAYGAVGIPDLNWGIVCERESSEAFAPLDDIARASVLTFLGLFGIGGLVAILASRGLVRPLERLAVAARAVASGDKSARVDSTQKDEIGEMAASFNAMVDELQRVEKVANSIRRSLVHDLKTPVTVIKGYAESLTDPGIASEPVLVREMAGVIAGESDRLTDDLKDILEPVGKDYLPDYEEFDLSLLVEKAVQSERHTKRSVDHVLITEGTDVPLLIKADRRKIRRVLENLVSNAVKYSPGDGKTVRVAVGKDPQGRAVVSVHDEGLGLSPEELYRVLTEGGRVTDHLLYGIEGTGLGLSSVRMILDAHGGELTAVSDKGVGSRFCAHIPLQPPQKAEGELKAPSD